MVEHSVAHGDGVDAVGEDGGPDGALAPDGGDPAAGEEGAEPVGQALADERSAIEQGLVAEHGEIGEGGGGRGGVAAVGVPVAQHERGVGLERRPHGSADEHAPDREVARAHALGEGDEVGAHAVDLGAEPRAQPPEAADDLVEDQEGAGGVAALAQPGEVAVGRRKHATRAHDRLGDDGGDAMGTVPGDDLVDRGQVVVGHLDYVAEQRAEARLVERKAGGGHRSVGHPVVRRRAADDDGAIGGAGSVVGQAGQLQRRVDRLGTAARQEHAGRRHRCDRNQLGRQRVGHRIGEAVERMEGREPRRLGRDGRHDLTPPVPDLAVPEAGQCVDVLTPVRVGDRRARTGDDRDERPPGRRWPGVRMEQRRNVVGSHGGDAIHGTRRRRRRNGPAGCRPRRRCARSSGGPR
ncbi:MAG: hypothetical protein QOF60_3318 [Actinomycetota bacterium]|nr:hypothetical protein [Actinomycetota bacterium]